MNSYPRREFLLRALAACGTPFLMPLAAVEGVQKPQAGTAAAGYFGGRTDAAVRLAKHTYGNWGSTRARSRFARRRGVRSRSSNGPRVRRMPSARWVLPCVVTSSRDDRCSWRAGLFHGQKRSSAPSPSFRRRTDPRHSKTTAHGAGASIINGCLGRAAVRNDPGGSNAFGFEL